MHVGELIAEGSQAQIFACEHGHVLKLFRVASRPGVAEEARKTELARALGCPAPRVYDVVEFGGRFGFVMERLVGPTLFQLLVSDPATAPSCAHTLAEVHASFASRSSADLPRLEPRLSEMIAAAPLPQGARDAAQHCLDACPRGDAVHHGDFHPLNVIATEHGPRVVDWYGAARAHPAADVAQTSLITATIRLEGYLPAQVFARIEPVRASVDAAYFARYLGLTEVTREQVRSFMRPLAAARLTDMERGGFADFDRERLIAIATGEQAIV